MSAPVHRATDQLALLALCGDLVLAIEAAQIHSIRPAVDTVSRPLERGLHAIELEEAVLPGWDVGELLGMGSCATAWVILDLPQLGGRLGLRVGRCLSVQQLPTCRALPEAIFTGRHGALAAAFAAGAISELAGHPSGAVLDPARLLMASEIDAGRLVRRESREAAVGN